MKRIIFSIYTNTVENHTSATDFKKSQFEKYKGELEESQKQYALLCGADYDLYLTNEKQYDTIQFDKLRRMEYFTQFYDEVVFLEEESNVGDGLIGTNHFVIVKCMNAPHQTHLSKNLLVAGEDEYVCIWAPAGNAIAGVSAK